jgi:hypothetical protein
MYNYTFFHGSALVRLIQENRITSIKSLSKDTYTINGDTCLFFKHSTKRLSPWSFTFLPSHINHIHKIYKKYDKVFIILICNDDGVCCLNFDEFSRIIFVGDFNKAKHLSISRTPRQKYTVSGADGRLDYKIGSSDFPKKLFF